MSGLILVFDLDQTLIDSNTFISKLHGNEPNSEKDISKYINTRIIDEVLRPAVNLKRNGVDAIFLLTNNNSIDYVGHVVNYLNSYLNTYIFNNIMIRSHPSRPQVLNPPKGLEEIKRMLLTSNPPIPFSDNYNIIRRTYFFDDNTKHMIRGDFVKMMFPNHYIEIQGPDIDEMGNNKGFITGKPDLSDYRSIARALKEVNDKPLGSIRPLADPPYLSLSKSKPRINLNHGGTRNSLRNQRSRRNRKNRRTLKCRR
jgi:hypothetical protein